jgi:hypothetical protein
MSTESRAGPGPLALPAEWRPSVRRAWPTVALSAATLAIVIALALLSGETNIPARTAHLVLAVTLLPVVPASYFLLVDPWRRSSWNAGLFELGTSSPTSTIFPNSIVANFLVYVLCLAILVFSAITAVFVRPLADAGTLLRAFATISPAVGVIALTVLVSPALRKRRKLGIGMSPEHVRHRWWFGCYTFRWEWITDVRPATTGNARIELLVTEPTDRPRDDQENWISRSRLFRRPKHIVVVGYLDVNPTIVYYALCFYRRHPELRHELGTEASLDRIQQSNFEDLEAEVLKHGRILETGPS